MFRNLAFLLLFVEFILIDNLFFVDAQTQTPIQGTKCAKNQVINKLTVYEDGAIEAECGPIPCGVSGERCTEDQSACRADTDVFSGMKWAPNGQSLLLRCCSYSVPNKIYVGTDLVSLGSYYTGGIAETNYEKKGQEYDFVSNVRTEQGGVRVWVYRIICPSTINQQHLKQELIEEKQKQFDLAAVEAARQQAIVKSQAVEQRRQQLLKQIAESQDALVESAAQKDIVNPLQYRPQQNRQHDAPINRII